MRAEDAIAYVSDYIKVASRTVVLLPRDAEALEYLRGCARELQDLAGTQARIRKLEADVRAAREANERERRSNGSLALELFEVREKLRDAECVVAESEAELTDDHNYMVSACSKARLAARAWKGLAKMLRADWLATLDSHDIAMTAQWESAMEAMGPERLTAADGYLCEAVKDLHAEVTKANALLADYEKRWGRVLRMGNYVRGIVPRASAWSEDYRLCATHIIANFPELLGKSEPLADAWPHGTAPCPLTGLPINLPIPCEEDPSGLGVVVTRDMAIAHMCKGGVIRLRAFKSTTRRISNGVSEVSDGPLGGWLASSLDRMDSCDDAYELLPIPDALARTCGAE